MIVPATSDVEGYARPREQLIDGWWTPGLKRLDKERMLSFVEDGNTEHLDGPTRRSVEATWQRVWDRYAASHQRSTPDER